MSEILILFFFQKKNFFSESIKISKIIEHYSPDVVHSVLYRSAMRVRFAKRLTNFVHVESLENTTYSRERMADGKVNQYSLWLYKYLDRITARKGVDHFHSITETVKDHYIKEIGLQPEKITVIPRGRKPILKKYEERPAKMNETFQIINVGRHEFQKGQINLVEAVKILKEEGKKIPLKILGREGGATPSLKKHIEDNGLQDEVSLEGFQKNVKEYLLNSDLFVFPSLYEGLGGALMEAQSAGLPVACNDIPVLHEVVLEDLNGKFFNVHDVNSIAADIRFFLDHPEKLEEFGKESLRNYKTKFSLNTNNSRILDLYEQLV